MTTEKKETTQRPVTAIILAAGKGTRMQSPLPKVLHPVCGRPMIEKIIQACAQAGIQEQRVVVGFGGQLVRAVVEPLGAKIYYQAQQLGTADAVKSAQIEDLQGDVVIVNGDHPLLEAQDLLDFLKAFREQQLELAVVTCRLKKPGQLGRIVRNQGQLRAIVEARDASADTLRINEINTGIYVVQSEILQDYLPRVRNQNAQGEFYLTDIVALAIEDHSRVMPIVARPSVAYGVNSQAELARATQLLFRRKAQQLMESGVLVIDPRSTYIEPSVQVAPGAVIYPQVYLRGQSQIGAFTSIEPSCYIVDTQIGESVIVKSHCHLEGASIAHRASIGPFARLRPQTRIGEQAHVGNFVEMKNVKFGAKSKAGHLTYLGDAEVGVDSNIGCGTITCNYAVDRKKYQTKIGSGVFVGSDTQFVAPITIGDNAVIGSGSTIVKNVPARALAVARSHQLIKENYVAEVSSVVKSDNNDGN